MIKDERVDIMKYIKDTILDASKTSTLEFSEKDRISGMMQNL